MNNKEILLHLSLLDGIGAAKIAAIVDTAGVTFSLADVYNMTAIDIQQYTGLNAAIAQQIVAGLADTKLLSTELSLIEKHNIQWCTSQCDTYPPSLKNIHLYPPVLYWQGNIDHDVQKSIAFVGARAANEYGAYAVKELIPPLIEHGYTIVSGGALGIDTLSHQVALDSGGNTLVVLGSGLLRPYPLSNKKLFAQICQSAGAVISSVPLLMEALPGNFPARNRIISGLSRGVVVVQAAARSGSLITAKFALDQGRDIFAVPGSITDPLSVGCHALIAQGAKIVTEYKDILVEFGHEFVAPEPEKAKKTKDKAMSAQMPLFTPALTKKQESRYPAGSAQGIIIKTCAQASSVDELAVATGLRLQEVSALLFDMRFEGVITQNFAGLWELG